MVSEKLVDKLIRGIPSDYESLEKLVMPHKNDTGSIVIFDDMIVGLNEHIVRIYTELSHHARCTVMFVSQNLFVNSPMYRMLSLNAQYLVSALTCFI